MISEGNVEFTSQCVILSLTLSYGFIPLNHNEKTTALAYFRKFLDVNDYSRSSRVFMEILYTFLRSMLMNLAISLY